jgi:hypothetical protein
MLSPGELAAAGQRRGCGAPASGGLAARLINWARGLPSPARAWPPLPAPRVGCQQQRKQVACRSGRRSSEWPAPSSPLRRPAVWAREPAGNATVDTSRLGEGAAGTGMHAPGPKSFPRHSRRRTAGTAAAQTGPRFLTRTHRPAPCILPLPSAGAKSASHGRGGSGPDTAGAQHERPNANSLAAAPPSRCPHAFLLANTTYMGSVDPRSTLGVMSLALGSVKPPGTA